MISELTFTLVGGLIGIIGASFTTVLAAQLSNRRRSQSIRAIAVAEVIAIMEKAERYISMQSNWEELAASTPLLASITSELGYLPGEQAIALRRAITLDMEMRISGTKEKAQLTIVAFSDALETLGN